ncbi:hypothetical protein [Halosimplex sp. J119]
MFDVTINAGDLDRALSPLSHLADYCIVEVTDSGVTMPLADEPKVASTVVEIEESAFESFDVSDTEFGLDLEEMVKILDNTDPDANIHLRLDFEINALYAYTGIQEFRIGLIDRERIDKGPHSLELDYSTTVEIGKSEFNAAVSAADMFSNHIRFTSESEGEKLVIKATGDTNMTRRVISNEEAENLSIETLDSTFDLEYLTYLNDSLPPDETLTLKLEEDRPLKADFDFADGDGHVTFTVAPRIKND